MVITSERGTVNVTNRVVWLLDVDGVLNANRPGWGGPPRSGNAWSDGQQFRIRWAPALVARIVGLHAAGVLEIFWCTSWCADASEIEALLGLPPFERAWDEPRQGLVATMGKIAAALRVLAAGHRLVWTDDAAIPVSGPDFEKLTGGSLNAAISGGWAPHTSGGQSLTTADGRALFIAPSPVRGLQPEHLDEIEAFAREVQQGGDGDDR